MRGNASLHMAGVNLSGDIHRFYNLTDGVHCQELLLSVAVPVAALIQHRQKVIHGALEEIDCCAARAESHKS